MIRLNGYDKPEYSGVQLERCGLLFLSTPHSGTTEADWNKLLLDIAKVSWGVRPEIVASLRAFNPTSSESQDQHANMKIKPPCAALYETKKTKVKGFSRHVCILRNKSNRPIAKTSTGCHSPIGKLWKYHCLSYGEC